VHRVLAVVIALVLGGAVAAAIVKNNNESKPLVLSSPTPTQTYTFAGPPPTAPTESGTPVVPNYEAPTASPTRNSLAGTGVSSTAAAAVLMLGIALAGGLVVRRASRGSR